MTNMTFRAQVLRDFGATPAEVSELLAYNENVFGEGPPPAGWPLAAEAHIATWIEYVEEANQIGAYLALQKRLVQLAFPIRPGMSQNEAYRAATRRGLWPEGGQGLVLTRPEQLRLTLYHSPAGPVPLLITGEREDFVALVQALTGKNEPIPVPDSMGACMVAGFNNWDRVARYRQQWQAINPAGQWQAGFQQLLSQKELYQDKFIILSEGPYSNVPAGAMGLDPEQWQAISLIIRRDHECAHYFTRRLFGAMRNNALDELIADYAGIVAGQGFYRADWFLRFMGLEDYPHYRSSGRLGNYRGQPSLSEGAFVVLQALVYRAAYTLEQFDRQQKPWRGVRLAQALMALTRLTLEELATPEALAEAWQATQAHLGRAG